MRGQVRRLAAKAFRGACEDRNRGVKREVIAGPGEAFEQPAADKSRSAGDENPGAVKAIPDVVSMLDDVLKVVGERVRHSRGRVSWSL